MSLGDGQVPSPQINNSVCVCVGGGGGGWVGGREEHGKGGGKLKVSE